MSTLGAVIVGMWIGAYLYNILRILWHFGNKLEIKNAMEREKLRKGLY